MTSAWLGRCEYRGNPGGRLTVPANQGGGIVVTAGLDSSGHERPGALPNGQAARNPTDRGIIDHAMDAVRA
jgi:hypothetical protein